MANNSSTIHNHQANPPPPTTSPTSMPDLPRVILADILSRLSIRSLFRCRCVCKPWRTLTTDPLFTKMYLSRASSSPPSLLIQAKSPKHGLPCDLYLAEPETCHSNDAVTKINTKFNRTNRQFELVGSINGLLCLSEPLYYDPIYLCNPLIGEYMTLPKPEIDTSFDVVSGFGFDEGSGQYKVIRMVYVTVRDPETRMVSFQLEGEIYTVGSGGGKWRRIGEVPYPLRARASEAYLNGALHWLMTDQDIGIDTSEFIGAFDVSTEEFRPVPPPPAQFCSESRTSARRFKLKLGVLGDKLCIFDNYFRDRVEIWMMNDYGVQSSWTKQFVIKRPRSMVVESDTLYFKPLKLTDNGEILMLFDSVAVVCYDPRTKIFRHLGLFGFHVTTDAITEGIVHVGSLISLRKVAACEGETRGVTADKSIKRQNSDIPYGTWDTILYPMPTHEPKLDIFKWLAEGGGVLHVARLDRPSVP